MAKDHVHEIQFSFNVLSFHLILLGELGHMYESFHFHAFIIFVIIFVMILF